MGLRPRLGPKQRDLISGGRSLFHLLVALLCFGVFTWGRRDILRALFSWLASLFLDQLFKTLSVIFGIDSIKTTGFDISQSLVKLVR